MPRNKTVLHRTGRDAVPLLPPRDGNRYWPMPPDYGRATDERKRQMRLALLCSWYNPAQPGDLMIRTPEGVELFLAALNFFVDFYYRPSLICGHQYHLPDCRHKPIMQGMFTSPRSALVAPRRSGKTFTLIYEMMPFIAITRPNTPILIGSETKELTYEKLKEIRRRLEGNERLKHDFGDLAPKRSSTSSREWTRRCLDFTNGSSIQGSSIDQSTRGRGPMAGVIDDAEGKKAKRPEWRERFMDWLMADYMGQFPDRGTHVMMIGTINFPDSCINRIVTNDDPENRFIGWTRHILKMIYEDPPDSGTMVSCWPERLTVEDFHRKLSGADDEDGSITPIGAAAAMAEFQGEPIPPGERMFPRIERKHGYLICGEGPDRYIYDPLSGKSTPFEEWFENTVRTGGMDVADTPGSRSDRSAIVVMAIDPDGVKWVVDAWEGAVFSDRATEEALRMGTLWVIGKMGWERGNQARIYREALKRRTELLAAGTHVPILVAINAGGVSKPQRIERMRPDWDAGLLRLPILRTIDGHVPTFRNRAALQRLLDEFDTMTGDGPSGRDDLIDACEMAHRVVDRRGKRAVHLPTGRRLVEHWERHGILVDPSQTHPDNWTQRMQEEWDRRTGPPPKPETGGEYCDLFC